MKKLYVLLWVLTISFSLFAQDVVKLPDPNALSSTKMTLMQALQYRKSIRVYSNKKVNDQTLSTLLWAACGYNRPTEKRITAPSAINAQDITIFVCRADGAYRYNPIENTLIKLCSTDLRADVAGRQEFAKAAPISLVLVSDLNKFRNPTRDVAFGAMDAGYVSENICLASVALGLATVPRATMNKDALIKALGLKENQIPELNHTLGWPQ